MNTSALIIVLLAAVCTLLTRLFPFAIFGRKTDMPPAIAYLGRILPSAMMATLVIYCVRGISFFSGSRGLPELIAIAVVVALHLWRHNTLLSISAGTICYMFLVQTVFAF